LLLLRLAYLAEHFRGSYEIRYRSFAEFKDVGRHLGAHYSGSSPTESNTTTGRIRRIVEVLEEIY